MEIKGYLKLPVEFLDMEEAEVEELEEKCRNLNITFKPKLVKGFKYFNRASIVSFNKDSEGNVCLNTSDGERGAIAMTFDEFVKIIEE